MEKYLQKYLERIIEKVNTIDPDDDGIQYIELAVYFKSKEGCISFIVDSGFTFKILEGALVIHVMYENTPYEYFIAIDDISYMTDEV